MTMIATAYNAPHRKPLRKKAVFRHTFYHSTIPLSMTPGAIQKRRFQRDRFHHVDARVCIRCKYAFISFAGNNYCSDCLHEICLMYCEAFLIPKGYHLFVGKWRGWASRVGIINSRVEYKTIRPRIPIPDLDSPLVKSAIARTFELMRKDLEAGAFVYSDRMPRLDGLAPYPHLEPIWNLKSKEGRRASQTPSLRQS